MADILKINYKASDFLRSLNFALTMIDTDEIADDPGTHTLLDYGEWLFHVNDGIIYQIDYFPNRNVHAPVPVWESPDEVETMPISEYFDSGRLPANFFNCDYLEE